MLQQKEGSRWYALFAVQRDATTEALRDHLFELRKKGFNRLYPKGPGIRILDARIAARHRFQRAGVYFSRPIRDHSGSPSANRRHHGDLLSRGRGSDLRGSYPPQPAPATLLFNEKFACKTCGIELATPEPGLFSFNNPMGACPRCQGFGNTIDYDMNLVIPDSGLTLDEGAVQPWTKEQYQSYACEFPQKHRAEKYGGTFRSAI